MVLSSFSLRNMDKVLGLVQNMISQLWLLLPRHLMVLLVGIRVCMAGPTIDVSDFLHLQFLSLLRLVLWYHTVTHSL